MFIAFVRIIFAKIAYKLEREILKIKKKFHLFQVHNITYTTEKPDRIDCSS